MSKRRDGGCAECSPRAAPIVAGRGGFGRFLPGVRAASIVSMLIGLRNLSQFLRLPSLLTSDPATAEARILQAVQALAALETSLAGAGPET